VSQAPIDLRGAALALLVSLLWGANPVAIKVGLEDAPPFRLAALRFLLGGAVIFIWARLTGRLQSFRIEPWEWRPLAVLGLLLCLQIGSMNYATSLTSAAHVAIILNLYAVHTVVLGHFLLPNDRLTLRKLAGVLIAYAGIVVLFARQPAVGPSTLVGDVLVFMSALVLAERTIYLAKAVQTFEPTKLLLTQAAIGTIFFFGLSQLVEPVATHWTLRLAGALVFQGMVVAGFNFVVNLWLLKRYRMSALAGFFLTQPIFGVVVAALLTGDPLTLELLIASVAVAIGIGLTSR
jgi:drug/metabolite transporter (DMT)-like permease